MRPRELRTRITGATLSVRAVSLGARKILHTIDQCLIGKAARKAFGKQKIVSSPTYFGPDRREQDMGSPSGVERRKTTFGQRRRSGA